MPINTNSAIHVALGSIDKEISEVQGRINSWTEQKRILIEARSHLVAIREQEATTSDALSNSDYVSNLPELIDVIVNG